MSSISADVISTCANCGKGEENGTKLKTCTACKLVKYCNRECQIAHRPQHKKECKKRAAELLCKGLDDMVISDDELFKQPPPKQDCPICMLPMPHAPAIFDIRSAYQPCCGKRLCNGCMLAAADEMDKGNMKRLCPFCRVPIHDGDDEFVRRCKIRMVHNNDSIAIQFLGSCYNNGGYGLPKDERKAMELYIRAAELGSAQAHYNIACLYENGQGVEEDMIKAEYHYKLAAIGGHEEARDKLGYIEGQRGNKKSLKHFVIGARCGYDDSLDMVGAAYKWGSISKDEYAKTLRAYQTFN